MWRADCGAALLGLVAIACAPPPPSSTIGAASSNERARPTTAVVRVTGSDTMINLLQAWAEAYASVRPDVRVLVAGGGSGVGIAALGTGLTDVAAASREMTPEERQRLSRRAPPLEITVALDAIAVYVHRTNPLQSIDLGQLAEIYGDRGTLQQWSALGVSFGSCRSGTIVRIGRQNSSGTYAYFREVVLGPRREYKLGSIDQSGSRDVVALVSRTPCAIGYSGLAYATPAVKALALAMRPGGRAVPPLVGSALDGSYPLARPLYFYTNSPPPPAAEALIAWIVGPAGQQIVREIGFIPTLKERP